MKWFPDCFNDIGFIATILGFAITIFQIAKLKNRQKALEIATNTAISKINNFDNLIMLSR